MIVPPTPLTTELRKRLWTAHDPGQPYLCLITDGPFASAVVVEVTRSDETELSATEQERVRAILGG